ncbi:MAG: AraC family transcriptional regulator [Bacteroidota bacterium]
MLGYWGWYTYSDATTEFLFFVPFMQVLIIGPVVYFYIQSLLYPEFKFQKKDWLHFIPGILYLIYSLVVFITDKYIMDEFYFYDDGRDKDLKAWYQISGLTSMMIYLVLSLRTYLRYKRVIYDIVSYADAVLFRWIQNFLIAFLLFVIIRVVFFYTNPQWENFGSQFWYFLAFSFIMLYIAISGYAQALKSISLAPLSVQTESVVEVVEKTAGSSIDNDKWNTRIIDLLENKKIYENPQLTLLDVAKELDTTTKTVSAVINSGFQMNFNDFINHYRIEDVKSKLKNGDHKHTTLLGIALESGFNSKATFNRAFKKSTEMTPKDYIEKFS